VRSDPPGELSSILLPFSQGEELFFVRHHDVLSEEHGDAFPEQSENTGSHACRTGSAAISGVAGAGRALQGLVCSGAWMRSSRACQPSAIEAHPSIKNAVPIDATMPGATDPAIPVSQEAVSQSRL
jgi:hypothetical protein